MGKGYLPLNPSAGSDAIRGGFYDYNDSGSATVNVPTGLVNVDITNDAAGAFTNRNFPVIGISDVWNETTNRFDWSQLKAGDMVDIRLELFVTTTSPNQLVIVDLQLAEGGFDYPISFANNVYKNAGVQTINRFNSIYMGDANTLDNPAKFVIRSDAAATVTVSGWYCRVLKRGP